MRTLTNAINHLADERDAMKRGVQKKIEEAKSSIKEKENCFAVPISELRQSVIVCDTDGHILLYNTRAKLMFLAANGRSEGSSTSSPLGLGRSIFAVLERSLISHGLDRIRQRLARSDYHPIANFVTSSQSDQLIRTQMASVMQTDADGMLAGRPTIERVLPDFHSFL